MRVRLVAVLILMLGVAGLTARADDWNKTFTVEGKPQISLQVDDGNIEVRTGSSGHIQADVETRGWRISNDEVRVEPIQTGNKLEIIVRVPHRSFNFGNHSIRVSLTVPTESTMDLRTRDGNVSVSGVKGDQRVSTGDGNLDLHNMDGPLVAHTGDGNIDAQGRFDLLDLSTGDGNIDAEVANGSRMNSNWTVNTGDGHITLRLPEGFSADLDARTGDGHVRSELPLTTTGSMRENAMRGKLNGGGHLLQIHSGDGDLRIEKL